MQIPPWPLPHPARSSRTRSAGRPAAVALVEEAPHQVIREHHADGEQYARHRRRQVPLVPPRAQGMALVRVAIGGHDGVLERLAREGAAPAVRRENGARGLPGRLGAHDAMRLLAVERHAEFFVHARRGA